MWSRVISLQRFDPEQIKLFQINSDLILENAMPKVPPTKRREGPWKPLFQPSEWKERHPEAKLENFAIKKKRLKTLCKQVIDIRQ